MERVQEFSHMSRFWMLVLILGLFSAICFMVAKYPRPSFKAWNRGPITTEARACFDGAGTISNITMRNPLTHQTMSFCEKNGKWFVRIDDDDSGINIDMYPRERAFHIQDVLEYAWDKQFNQVISR